MRFSIIPIVLSTLHFAQALQYHGANFSSLANLEKAGKTYKDSGTTTRLETILHNHGVNLARIRIWTSTDDGQYSLNYGLALAKRAVAVGMQFCRGIDKRFVTTRGGPGKAGNSELLAKGSLRAQHPDLYTMNLVKSFSAQGTPITNPGGYVTICLELYLTNSPRLATKLTAECSGLQDKFWPMDIHPLSQMLHSAASGVRAASSSTKIMIHLADGWNSGAVTSFYNQVFIAGQLSPSDVDVMGFSFYPFYNTGATVSALKSSLQNIINKYGKDVMVVETDWPVSCSDVSLSDSTAVSAAGQSAWVAKIRDTLSSLSGGHGIGIVYWEPGWIGNANLGSGCSDNLLVDGSGNTCSSISMFSSSM